MNDPCMDDPLSDSSPNAVTESGSQAPVQESNLKKPLPKDYSIPELPTLLYTELNEISKIFHETGERKQFSRKHLTKLLDIIASDVSKYTLKPSSEYVIKIARTLVTKYPALAPSEDPYSKWINRLNDKFRSLRNQLKKVQGAESVAGPREAVERPGPKNRCQSMFRGV